MNAILTLPVELRLLGVILIGLAVGSAVNGATYALAWNRRPIGPWFRPHADAPPRRWWDRLPVIGWWGLRRESALWGRGFWIRPMVVELLAAAGLARLYYWEVEQLALLPELPPGILAAIPAQTLLLVHQQFFVHAVLMTLMLVASLIDIDEKTIPDGVTVAGTLFALAMAALVPASLLPVDVNTGPARVEVTPLLVSAPLPYPASLEGAPVSDALLAALGCWWLWCVGLMNRKWYPRHGWRRALGLALARLRRDRSTARIALLGLAGSAGIALVWWRGGDAWRSELTALVGMAASGGLVWLVRIIGTAALRREAMGFGDVTLMAMIGAAVGWQTSLMIFFLAPLAGICIGLVVLVVLRDREIPYGPFLCLATGFAVVRWCDLWQWAEPTFAMGLIVPMLVLICLVLLGLMLTAWRLISGLFGRSA